MIMIHPELGLIVNFGLGSWCFSQCEDREVENEEKTEKRVVHLIVHVFAGGVSRPVMFENPNEREKCFKQLCEITQAAYAGLGPKTNSPPLIHGVELRRR